MQQKQTLAEQHQRNIKRNLKIQYTIIEVQIKVYTVAIFHIALKTTIPPKMQFTKSVQEKDMQKKV